MKTKLLKKFFSQNNGAQQLASEATVQVMLEDVNDEIPLFTEREQETVLEGEPIGSKVTTVNAIDKDGTSPNNKVRLVPNFTRHPAHKPFSITVKPKVSRISHLIFVI